MSFSKLAKWLKWLIGATIIGALGSGFWEKILSPFLTFAFGKIINLLSNLSSTYSDNLYTSIANSIFSNTNSKLFAYQILGVILLIIFVFISNVLSERKVDYMKALLHFAIFLAALLILFMYFSSRLSYIHKASTNSHINLEIIRPYIGEQKYLELRSSFFQIKTKKDFDIFEEKINNHSKDKNLNLLKFSDE